MLLVVSQAAAAYDISSVWLENLTVDEVRERLAGGVDTVLIPTGGTEPNGAHLTLGKHNMIVEKTAETTATLLGKALVAPVVAYVPERAHGAAPGTISLRETTFEALLEDAARSFKAQGFRWIVLMGDSAENQAPQIRVAKRLTREWKAEGVRVISLRDYYADNHEAAWVRAAGLHATDPEVHAGFLDTAELRAAAPEHVREEAVPDVLHAATAAVGKRLLTLKSQAAVLEIRRIKVAP